MYEQLSFFEEPQTHSFKYDLFLAIFPDHYTAEQIIDLGSALRQTHGMRGRLRPISHLHVSLLFLGGTMDVSERVVEAIGQVCKSVTAITSPFEIKFDRILSFRGHAGNHPPVLVDDNHGNEGVRNLHGLLHAESTKYFALPRSISQFVPHLTLLYDKQELASKSIEPVSWMVKEIVLVRSEVGLTKYHWLGRWALGEQGYI
jgi:RNA 2',3'-cyclic 3'-phosphodiesterase